MIRYIMISLIFSITIARSQENDTTKHSEVNENIINQLNSLSLRGCLFGGHGANPTQEEINDLNTLTSLSLLSQSDLKLLLKSTNPYTKVYVFNAICLHHPNSLIEDDLKILKDTSKLLFCLGDTAIDAGITVGAMATESYGQIESRIDWKITKKEIEKIIKEFILQYAQFPESYESIDFKDYIIHSTVDSKGTDKPQNGESYEITHRYRIKDKNGELREFSHFFILTNDLSINIIEFPRSKNLWVSPPELEIWLELVGRELSKKELKNLQLAQKTNANNK
jgi:hypothetical protein